MDIRGGVGGGTGGEGWYRQGRGGRSLAEKWREEMELSVMRSSLCFATWAAYCFSLGIGYTDALRLR